MKAIFLCDNTDTVQRVFGKNATDTLCNILDLDTRIYTGEDLLADPDRFSDVEIIFSTWGIPELNESEIEAYLPNLKCIFYGAGSVQRFARPYLNRGVRIFSAWAANAVPVAELTAAEIVLANKGYFVCERLYKTKGRRVSRECFGRLPGNFDETVGIIGAGMIGRKVIELLKHYRLNVLVYDPFLPDCDAEALGVRKCSLEEIFSEAMTISNHLANKPETQGMINYDLLCRMRHYATFVNTGRGAQVVTDDLIRILRERDDLTALLDVTDPEPLPESHPLFSLENCLITPHIAGSSGNEVMRMGDYMVSECISYLGGAPCSYEVTPKMLETMA